jgi:branched-chain amino acid transport system substrate-binding protein
VDILFRKAPAVRFPRRVTAAVAVAALLTTGLAGCSSDDDQAAAPADVMIGADLAASSPTDAAYGRALQLRIDQINSSGVLGQRRLRLSVLDNRSDPTVSLRNISAFADNPAVAAVVSGYCSACISNAYKTINEKKVPTIALAPANQVAQPVQDRRFIFKLGPNSGDSAAALVGALKADRVSAKAFVKKVGVLSTDDDYGTGAKAAFTSEAAKAGLQIPSSVTVKSSATDITQAVGTLADSEPDALVFLVGPDQAALAATSAKAAGFAGKIYYDAAAAGDLFIPQEAEAATEGAKMVFTQTLAIDDVIATTPAKAARKQWFRDYTSRYGTYNGVAALAADAVNVLADAIARNGTDRVAIRDAVETAQLDGISGAIRLTPDNHSGLMPQALTLLVARSGRWRLAS